MVVPIVPYMPKTISQTHDYLILQYALTNIDRESLKKKLLLSDMLDLNAAVKQGRELLVIDTWARKFASKLKPKQIALNTIDVQINKACTDCMHGIMDYFDFKNHGRYYSRRLGQEDRLYVDEYQVVSELLETMTSSNIVIKKGLLVRLDDMSKLIPADDEKARKDVLKITSRVRASGKIQNLAFANGR